MVSLFEEKSRQTVQVVEKKPAKVEKKKVGKTVKFVEEEKSKSINSKIDQMTQVQKRGSWEEPRIVEYDLKENSYGLWEGPKLAEYDDIKNDSGGTWEELMEKEREQERNSVNTQDDELIACIMWQDELDIERRRIESERNAN
jgi:hypothetical protein